MRAEHEHKFLVNTKRDAALTANEFVHGSKYKLEVDQSLEVTKQTKLICHCLLTPRLRSASCLLSNSIEQMQKEFQQNILEAVTHPYVSLDTSKMCGQVYDGASVMSSNRDGVKATIKVVSPRALYTHCYCHCLNLSIAASCEVQEVNK